MAVILQRRADFVNWRGNGEWDVEYFTIRLAYTIDGCFQVTATFTLESEGVPDILLPNISKELVEPE